MLLLLLLLLLVVVLLIWLLTGLLPSAGTGRRAACAARLLLFALLASYALGRLLGCKIVECADRTAASKAQRGELSLYIGHETGVFETLSWHSEKLLDCVEMLANCHALHMHRGTFQRRFFSIRWL